MVKKIKKTPKKKTTRGGERTKKQTVKKRAIKKTTSKRVKTKTRKTPARKPSKKGEEKVKKIMTETPDTEEETTQEETQKEEGTIGDIMKAEGLVTEPDRESMLKSQSTPKLSEITMKIDRISGKLELFKGMLDSFSERILDMNERLGDTRRMVFEREKTSSKIETRFDKVETIVKDLDPEIIVLRFEKFKASIDKQNSNLERIKELLTNVSDRLNITEKKLSKIKSIDNIVNAGKIVEEKIKTIEDTKKYSDKMASKVEAMFLGVNEKISGLTEILNKIDKNDVILQDSLKDIDKIRFQIDEDLVKKKQIDSLIDSVKDIIVEEVVGINPVAFDNLRRRISLLENKTKTPQMLEGEKKKLILLSDQIERDYQMGRLNKDSYSEIKKSIEKKVNEIEMVSERKSKRNKSNKPPQVITTKIKTKLSELSNDEDKEKPEDGKKVIRQEKRKKKRGLTKLKEELLKQTRKK